MSPGPHDLPEIDRGLKSPMTSPASAAQKMRHHGGKKKEVQLASQNEESTTGEGDVGQ